MSPYSYIKFLANLQMWSRQKVRAFPKKIEKLEWNMILYV